MKYISAIMIICFIVIGMIFFGTYCSKFTNGTMNGGIEQGNLEPFITFVIIVIFTTAAVFLYKLITHKKK